MDIKREPAFLPLSCKYPFECRSIMDEIRIYDPMYRPNHIRSKAKELCGIDPHWGLTEKSWDLKIWRRNNPGKEPLKPTKEQLEKYRYLVKYPYHKYMN